ncbi:MAG: DUF3164 family protein [Spirochaetaceae bacterium]|nr:DUF3164 family protein [Spirochaetaceae bacterium]
MEDQMGRLWPDRLISPVDRERDKLVRELVEEGQKLSAALAAYKAKATSACQAFVDRSASEFGTTLGGEKGNVTLSTFDGRLRLTLATYDRIQFDERLQVAKKLIDGCIKRWTKNSNSNAKTLIQQAFKVDRRGRLDVPALLELRTLEIDDPEWKKAMDALSKAIKVSRSQQYLRLQRRREDGGYDPIPLALAGV